MGWDDDCRSRFGLTGEVSLVSTSSETGDRPIERDK